MRYLGLSAAGTYPFLNDSDLQVEALSERLGEYFGRNPGRRGEQEDGVTPDGGMS